MYSPETGLSIIGSVVVVVKPFGPFHLTLSGFGELGAKSTDN